MTRAKSPVVSVKFPGKPHPNSKKVHAMLAGKYKEMRKNEPLTSAQTMKLKRAIKAYRTQFSKLQAAKNELDKAERALEKARQKYDRQVNAEISAAQKVHDADQYAWGVLQWEAPH